MSILFRNSEHFISFLLYCRNTEEFKRLTDEIHGVYLNALLDLWNTHKDTYAPNRVREMQFIKD
jgi:hypothetical protein